MVKGLGLPGAALGGLQAALSRFDAAAAKVVQSSTTEGGDTVSLSGETPADWPSAMVDLRVQKYAVVANLRVVSTAFELQAELSKLGER